MAREKTRGPESPRKSKAHKSRQLVACFGMKINPKASLSPPLPCHRHPFPCFPLLTVSCFSILGGFFTVACDLVFVWMKHVQCQDFHVCHVSFTRARARAGVMGCGSENWDQLTTLISKNLRSNGLCSPFYEASCASFSSIFLFSFL